MACLSASGEGVRIVEANAPGVDAYLLFTCTVTANADRDTRKLVHRLRRNAPEALVVLTGCMASAQTETARALAGVDLVLPADELARLPTLLREHAGTQTEAEAPSPTESSLPARPGVSLPPLRRGGDRPYLKVQDGCDACCAYCILPSARGGLRSAPVEQALASLSDLETKGALEVVITGINLARWGRDLAGAPRLPELLEALLGSAKRARVRLSSLEPEGLDDDLLAVLAGSERACHHLHVPLQSGDDGVLRAMGRPYTVAAYARKLERARRRLPGLTVGSDLLVGFPGESDQAHRRTLAAVRELRLDYLHVFSFSPRPGTRAEAMGDSVERATKRARSAELRALDLEGRQRWCERWLGQRVEVLVEGRLDRKSQRPVGYGREYQRVLLQQARATPGPYLCEALVLSSDGRRLVARVDQGDACGGTTSE